MYINVAMASIVPTPLLQHREYGLITWADHLSLVITNRSISFENTVGSEMGRGVLHFFGIGIICTITIYWAVSPL